MKRRMVLDGAPIAAIEAIAADEVQGARNVATRTLRQNEQATLRHRFSKFREESPVEVGPTPFAVSGIHVESEHGVPVCFRDSPPRSRARCRCRARSRSRAPCVSPCVCVTRASRENRRKSRIRGFANEIAGRSGSEIQALGDARPCRTERNVRCTDDSPPWRATSIAAAASSCSSAKALGPGFTRRRGPGTGVNGTRFAVSGNNDRQPAHRPRPSHDRKHIRPGCVI